MRWLQFFLSHSVFISLCAVALCFQTYTLLQVPANSVIYAFVFFSTLGSYNFYWLISKYAYNQETAAVTFLKNNISYLGMFILAGIGMLSCLYFIFSLLPYILIAVMLTLVYSLPLWPFKFSKYLRQAGVLKTTLLAFTWAYVTTVIPVVDVMDKQLIPVSLLFMARFFFMLMLCLIFDTRDIKLDKMHALHSLATDVSRKTLHLIMLVSFVFYLMAGLSLRYLYTDNFHFAAFFITGLAVWLVYRLSLKKQGYIFYYFVVDGLMLFSAAVTFLASRFK